MWGNAPVAARPLGRGPLRRRVFSPDPHQAGVKRPPFVRLEGMPPQAERQEINESCEHK
jgi:hypothetical protein